MNVFVAESRKGPGVWGGYFFCVKYIILNMIIYYWLVDEEVGCGRCIGNFDVAGVGGGDAGAGGGEGCAGVCVGVCAGGDGGDGAVSAGA